jgi:deoxyadenosine/deoxycytidine kinase
MKLRMFINIKLKLFKKIKEVIIKKMVYIFSVEGNIGSGKSTIVKYLKEHLEIEEYYIIFLQEPVEIWNTITDTDGTTIIQRYYSDQEKYSFAFQMMAYISRLNQIKNILKDIPENSIIITERCLYTDFNIFAKMLYHTKLLSEIEYSIYTRWFDEFIDFSYITSYIYITTSPDICLQRISCRSRKGEDLIPLEYLEDCDRYHRNWLNNEHTLDIESNLNVETVNRIKEYILKFVKKQ